MGYLELSGGIGNFSRAIISIWFRIPSATFTAMSAVPYPISPHTDADQRDHASSAYYTPPLYKIIPLITFGSVEIDILGNQVQPSFIGVDCIGDGINALCCNLQTPLNGSVSGVDAAGPGRPGCFYMSGWTVGTGPGTTDTYVAPDVWHHALISFDISGSESFTGDPADPGPADVHYSGTSTFSWALDDVSKVGLSMSPSGATGVGLAANIIVSNVILDVTGDTSDTPLTASLSGGHIAASGNAVGIPFSANYVSNGQQVEFGPVHFFTGISADATDSSTRRLFVTADGKPATATAAQASLGQAPVIRFDKLADWRTGANKGSGGNFATTGAIEGFTPGPDLTP